MSCAWPLCHIGRTNVAPLVLEILCCPVRMKRVVTENLAPVMSEATHTALQVEDFGVHKGDALGPDSSRFAAARVSHHGHGRDGRENDV